MDLLSPVSSLPLVGPVYVKRLEKLEIFTIQDLLFHVPRRYIDYRIVTDIEKVQVGEKITVKGNIISFKNVYTKRSKNFQIAEIADDTGTMQAVWFNQSYLSRSIHENEKYSFSGKIDWFERKKSFISPQFENIENNKKTVHTGRLVPVYPETSGVSSKWLRGRIEYIFETMPEGLEEYLPRDILSKNSFPPFFVSLDYVHHPTDLKKAEKGKKRLAFDEVLFHQLKSQYRKEDWKKIKAVNKLKTDKTTKQKFIKSLPFELTNSQQRAIKEIFAELENDVPMNRLLEGDVGSGKTVVAASAAFAAFVNGYQSVFMAPTQILAQQHFDTLKKIFKDFKVRVSLITSAGIKADLGKSDILVGTHALIHKKVDFDNVALVVIDEQHRFGVEQRAHLIDKSGKKNKAPHVLTMTATPIPRSIALTVYGDLDLSTLEELPKGRQPITTWLVPPQKREGAYDWIGEKIKEDNIQVFVICPLIEESEKDSMQQVKAATAEYEKLKNRYSELEVSLLHGKQNAKDKNKIIDSFKNGKTHILVSTPVVEVGIDVPNATIMIIEGAERFGLAQLHQLRGRIGRGSKKSYCLLFTTHKSGKSYTRLKALQKTMSGFELAELDLKIRGPGEIFGTRQHGFPELKIASWQDTELIKKARGVAKEAIDKPKKYRRLINKFESQDIVLN